MKRRRSKILAPVIVSTVLLAGVAAAAVSTATQRIEPASIDLGDASRLTISESGTEAPAITPPMVPGLEFVAVGQSQQVESINGVTHSTTSVTYQVIPRRAGVFSIPSTLPGSNPVTLTVNPGAGGNAASPGGSTQAGVPEVGVPQGSPALPAASTRQAADGSAFVRLRLSKHELYVGETVPIDIEVGMRDGFVASLNGLPTLNGDAFTLHQLSTEPRRSEEIIDGKPFTVLAWHSALAAVKPGVLSLTIETPLTVRMRTAAHPETGPFGAAALDDLFNDPMLQNFFGASKEKDIIVASAPTAFTVLALPTRDQPADFSGAVGHFTVRSDLSDDKAVAGDPITLRMRVSGTGNFDRVSTSMLHDIEHWKTYSPTASFKADDDVGYRGEKIFEQPIIALKPGPQSVPALTFSWFDPSTGHYAAAHTLPLSVAITPASTDGSMAGLAPTLPARVGTTAVNERKAEELRPDHVESARGTQSLVPHYYQPVYMAVPSFLLVAFSGAWFWAHRRSVATANSADEIGSPVRAGPLLRLMDEASTASDSKLFFQSARAVLRGALAPKWQMPPEKITFEDVDARLGTESDIACVFKLADEAEYSGARLESVDFQRWKQMVLHQIDSEAMS